MNRMTWPGALGDLLQDRLQALLELAAVLGAGDERAHVERDDALVPERLRHVAAHDPLGEALDDGGLAHARLADQHGVVLRPAAEHLDDAADLLVPAHHRVELAVAGNAGQVAAVLLECLVGRLGVLRGHALASAHAGEGLQDLLVRGAVLVEDPLGLAARLRHAEQQVLGGDVLVLEAPRLVLGAGQHVTGPRVERE